MISPSCPARRSAPGCSTASAARSATTLRSGCRCSGSIIAIRRASTGPDRGGPEHAGNPLHRRHHRRSRGIQSGRRGPALRGRDRRGHPRLCADPRHRRRSDPPPASPGGRRSLQPPVRPRHSRPLITGAPFMPSTLSVTAVLAVALAAGPALAQGIPVFDATNTAQAIQQVQQGVQQLQQLKAQLDQAQQLYGSLNQISNIGDVAQLLGNPTLRQYLPPEFSQLQGVLTANTANDYLNLAGRAATLYDQSSVKPGDDYYNTELARIGTRSAGETSLAQQIYDSANSRLQGLQELQAKG